VTVQRLIDSALAAFKAEMTQHFESMVFRMLGEGLNKMQNSLLQAMQESFSQLVAGVKAGDKPKSKAASGSNKKSKTTNKKKDAAPSVALAVAQAGQPATVQAQGGITQVSSITTLNDNDTAAGKVQQVPAVSHA
jgi:hypothetical protein